MTVFAFLVSGIVEDGAVLLIIWIFKVFRTWNVFSMKNFVFLVSGLLKINFSMKVFVFLDLGLLNFDFFNENIFFWIQAYWKWIFQWESWFLLLWGLLIFFSMRVFVFLSQAYWKSIFQWKCVFLGVRAIENRFFNESLCFFGLRHCGRRCRVLFSFEFVNFLRPEVFFNESPFFWERGTGSVHFLSLLVVVYSCFIATFPQAACIVQAGFFSEKVERWLF